MKAIFKKLDIIGVTVLMLTFSVTFGFTAAESIDDPTWYEVEIRDGGSANNPQDQEIKAALPGNPIGDCIQTSGTICAVNLTLGSSSKPVNMQEALELHDDDDADLTIEGESFRL